MCFMNELYRKIRDLPFVTFVLVGINVVVFFLGELGINWFYRVGMLSYADVLYNGEYGRIVWSMFLHEGIEHLFNNMILLLFLGAMLEREIGHIAYTIIYFLSGISGNLLSLWIRILNTSFTYSLGASGAIFGMDGLLLALVLLSHRRIQSVTPARVLFMIILSLYSGFRSTNVDNAAHVGGLITGFLLGAILCGIRRRRVAGGRR